VEPEKKCGKIFHIEPKNAANSPAIGSFFNENMGDFNHFYSCNPLVQRTRYRLEAICWIAL